MSDHGGGLAGPELMEPKSLPLTMSKSEAGQNLGAQEGQKLPDERALTGLRCNVQGGHKVAMERCRRPSFLDPPTVAVSSMQLC